MRSELISAITKNQSFFGLGLLERKIGRLADYYELVHEHTPRLNLVGPCSAEEFAVRHILESLLLLEHLPQNAKFADVGTGAGLPSIPCLLVRDDLRATLIESKEKKGKFLETAVTKLGLTGRAQIVSRQFTETQPEDCRYVTSRALDRFTDKLPRLVRWSGTRKLLLYGGANLKDALEKCAAISREQLIPMSERRFLFSARYDGRS